MARIEEGGGSRQTPVRTTKTVTANTVNYGSPATQIKKTDKSWKDVEARTGTPLATLTALNQAKTIPPVGSFVLTQPVNNTQLQYQTPAGPPKPGPVYGPPVPPNYSSSNYYNASMQQYAQPPKTTPANQGRGGAAIHAGVTAANSVMATINRTGQLPRAIPVSAMGYLKNPQTGQVLTIQQLAQAGYVSDGHGNYVLKQYAPVGTTTPILGKNVPAGSGNGSNSDFMNTGFMRSNQEKNVDFVNQLRYDPVKKKYVRIGDLIKQGKLDVRTGKFYPNGRNAKHGGVKGGYKGNKGGSSNQPTVTTGQNILEGPQTVLDIHLGSG